MWAVMRRGAENAVNAYCEPDDDADSHEVARLRSAAHAAIHLAMIIDRIAAMRKDGTVEVNTVLTVQPRLAI
jgi:hypothetical protein